MIVEYRDGKHWPTLGSIIHALRLPKSKGYVTVMFSEQSKYIQPGGVDQGDYLKILGKGSISMMKGPEGYWVRKKEAILSWRYNPKEDVFELVWHFRIDGVRSTQMIQRVVAGVPVKVNMKPASGFGVVPILPFFGGTSVEPKDGKSTKILVKKS